MLITSKHCNKKEWWNREWSKNWWKNDWWEQSCYTIAEAGANHDGELIKAFKLIDAAVKANADSVKFQTYTADKLTTKNAPKYWDDGKKN